MFNMYYNILSFLFPILSLLRAEVCYVHLANTHGRQKGRKLLMVEKAASEMTYYSSIHQYTHAIDHLLKRKVKMLWNETKS